jgi:outer membrane protein assembly factor BamE
MRPILLPLFALALLAGCTAHKMEIQQGNIVSRERLALVKPGMEPQQVRYALGSPLIQDPFHPDRWDYYYRLTRNGEEELNYRVTLQFVQGKLAKIEEQGPIPATEREAIQTIGKKDSKDTSF